MKFIQVEQKTEPSKTNLLQLVVLSNFSKRILEYLYLQVRTCTGIVYVYVQLSGLMRYPLLRETKYIHVPTSHNLVPHATL